MLSRHLLPLATMTLLGSLLGSACTQESKGRPDSELGSLVISPKTVSQEVDLARASSDPASLLAAVRLPDSWIEERLGGHVVQGTTSVDVQEGEAVIESLSDTLRVDIDDLGRYRATLDNSNEYGRHAIFDGSHLYLRPRFGLYHERAPQSETEAADIRDEMTAGAGDYLELLAKGLAVQDGGEAMRGGRKVRQIRLSLAAAPRDLGKETLTQRQWRDSIDVKTLSGTVALDVATGAAIFIQLDGSLGFDRDGRHFVMSLHAEREITDIGHERNVEPPASSEVLRIAPRRREVDERNALLKNIAPPAHRAAGHKKHAGRTP